jgi:hypothetical protein
MKCAPTIFIQITLVVSSIGNKAAQIHYGKEEAIVFY